MSDDAPASRLERLLSYLRDDPMNLALIADACTAALDVGRPGEASRLIELYAEQAPLPPPLVNLAGLVALQEKRFGDAAEIFGSLVDQRPDDPVLRFNLASAEFMRGACEAAAELIDDAIVAAAPQAACMKVQALHMSGKLDEALAWGERAAQQHPDDQALMGALSVLALDLDRPDLARAYGDLGDSTPEGLSTLGALELGAGNLDEANQRFEAALQLRSNSARALLGKGLVMMAREDPAAADWLRQGATIFGDHLGSWVAVGWAEIVAGRPEEARQAFEQALALDDTFAEIHGGLAVVAAMAGDWAAAETGAAVAGRLDRNSFSAAFANSLIRAAKGDPAGAERIRQMALSSPIAPGGQTLAQAVAGFATQSGRASS